MLASFKMGLVGGQRALTPLAAVSIAAARGELPLGKGVLRWLGNPIVAAGALALGALRGAGRLRRDWPSGLVALALPWFVLPPAILLAASLIHPVYTIRYIAFCIPAAALLAGAALAALGRLPGLAAHWRPVLAPALDAVAQADGGPIVDCRSGGYAAMWKAPAERTATVDVFQLRGGEPTVVSHFAKHTRGLVARALLEAGARATGALDRAAEVVAAAGAGDVEGRRWDVELVAPSGAKPGSLRVVLPEA